MVTTISPHHNTKCKAIRDTWGTQCDKLIFVSNETDPSIGSVDDDAFVIVDNLRDYLASSEIVSHQHKVPMQLGHNFRLPPENARVIGTDSMWSEFQKRFGSFVDYNSGGSGYVMNRLYVERFVQAIDKPTCLPGEETSTEAEDFAIAFCMKWEEAVVVDTRDFLRRPRFHYRTPSGTYHATHSEDVEDQTYWEVVWHKSIGGYRGGVECCSDTSIAFHYVEPVLMDYLAAQLHYCRNQAFLTLDESTQ